MGAQNLSLDSGHSSEKLSHGPRVKSNNSSQQLLEKQVDPVITELGSINEAEGTGKGIGWIRLTVLLIVEAIALGCLSIPATFATVGMIGGVILTVGLGLIAIYTSYLVGEVKMKYPHVMDYPEAVRQFGGRVGYVVIKIEMQSDAI
jgi:hypothetical protein